MKNIIGFSGKHIPLLFCLLFHLKISAQINTAPDNPGLTADQNDSLPGKNFRQLKETEVNFLFSYYEQDGNHSPVTGGIGTEELTDLVAKMIVNVPFGNGHSISAINGIDHYTSASTDNINNIVSSASYKDSRHYHTIGYSREIEKSRITYGLNAGISDEWDVRSFSGGGLFVYTSKNENMEINLSTQMYHDVWEIIYPSELRVIARQQGEFLEENIRNSYDVSLTLSRVINKKLQASFSAEVVYQQGLLSTPFHRVYFVDSDTAGVEQLPDRRIKYPFGFRLNYYVNEYLVLRTFYRYYLDNFFISAHTLNIEIPIKIVNYFTFIPFYRYYNQTAALYFKPYKQHVRDEIFYTSDYDLSALSSHKYGIELRYSPLYGLGRFKAPFSEKKIVKFKSIDLRYARYSRTDGLKAFVISLGTSFIM